MKSLLFVFFVFFLLVQSCSVSKGSMKTIKNRSENQKYVSSSELYQPIYEPNGGDKKQNIFNRGKAEREGQLIAALKALGGPIQPPSSSDDLVDKSIQQAVNDLNFQIIDLEKQLLLIDLSKKESFEQIIGLLEKIHRLKCEHIEGISLLNKKVDKLYGDISFKVGSSDVSARGIQSIDEMTKRIENEVSDWKSYLNSCNVKIFEQDLFVVMIQIDGYADQQGSESQNLILSQKRADSVKKIILNRLNGLLLEKKIKIIFNKVYSSGKGEQLPPGIKQNGENDPLRRVCIINSIVGPSRYLND
jgi:outer membrane protein OmpA-like peptidoglycan-associated protein